MQELDFIRVSLLALIQGLTEFLPISSSAHLIFPSALLGWEDQGLAFDVAVHLGTLLAVITYFSKDILAILKGWGLHVARRQNSEEARLGWMLLLATLPLVVCGLLLEDIVDTYFRNTTIIATTTIIFALLLWLADKMFKGSGKLQQLSWQRYLFVGLAQVLALVPGTSRSGVTMTAALFCQLNRREAARLSFLLAIPAIAGASILLFFDLLGSDSVNWLELAYAMLLSGMIAFLCIHYFLKLIVSVCYMPFVIYRLLLGAVLIIFFV